MKRAEFERLEVRRERWKNVFQIVAAVLLLLLVGLSWLGSQKSMITIGSPTRAYERNEVVNLLRAVKAYEMHFSMLPFPDGRGEDVRVESDERLINVFNAPSRMGGPLLYKGVEARGGRRGLLVVDPNLGPRLVDSWGRPYVLILDGDYDGFVTGPDGERVAQSVICYSLGEDGVFDAKDPKSW